MERLKRSGLLLVAGAFFLFSPRADAQYSVATGVFTGGAARASGGHQSLATVGQSTGGVASGTAHTSKFGFWYRPPTLAVPTLVALSGATTAGAGTEVQVLSAGVTGNGQSSVNSIALTLADLSAATGLTAGEIGELRLYRSTDASLGSGDTQIGSQATVGIGSATTVSATTPDVPPLGTERYYLVTAVLSNTVTDGHAFKVECAAGGVSTSAGGLGAAVVATDVSKVTIDVAATQLVFTTQPGSTTHLQALSVSPVVAAQDAYGNLDTGFGGTVTLGMSPSGTLTNNTVAAANGATFFSGVTVSGAGSGRTLAATSSVSGISAATSASFDVAKAPATITMSFAKAVYDGGPKSAGPVTDPPGLSLDVTYNGLSTQPTGPGSYGVVATITDPDYEGQAEATLVIDPPAAPEVGLKASVTQGNPPLKVTFTDASSGYILSWFLETFDDHGTTFEDRSQPAQATYSTPGTHEALLTVKGPGSQVQTRVAIGVHASPQLEPIPSVSAEEDEILVLDLSGKDPEPGTWSIGETDAALIARVEPQEEGFRFVPVADASGTDVVGITRTNEHVLSTSQDVQLRWEAVDDPPVIEPGLESAYRAEEDAEIHVGGVAHAHDIDTDVTALVWSASGYDEELIATAAGSPEGVVFTPVADAHGETPVTVQLTDPATGAAAAQEITLTWTPVNDPPDAPVAIFPEDGAGEVSLAPVVSWTAADADGDSLVHDFYLGVDGDPLEMMGEGLEENSYGLMDLRPGTGYVCQVVVRDPAGESAEVSFAFTTEPDRRPPVISAVRVGVTEESATLSWSTDEPAVCLLRYGLAQPPDREAGGADLEEGHRYVLEGLEPGTWYYYELSSTDEAGNVSEGVSGSFLTLAAPDTEPPQILRGPIVEGLTQESAVIGWTTDELSTSIVRYVEPAPAAKTARVLQDDADGLPVEIVLDELVEDHRVRLADLKAATQYPFEIQSQDAAGNQSETHPGVCTTAAEADLRPPSFVAGPAVRSVSDAEATVELGTDELTRAQVRFDADEDLSDGRLAASAQAGLEHQMLLAGLEPGTAYYYQVQIADESGNEAKSDLRSFQTRAAPDEQPPEILAGPAVEGRSDEGGVLVFATHEPTRFRVLLAAAAAPELPWLREGTEFRLSHRLSLTHLEPDTEYLYEVQVRDAADNAAPPVRGQFRTRKQPDTVPPRIVQGPIAEGIGVEIATVVWHTSELSTGTLRFGPTPEAEEGSIVLMKLDREHRVQLTQLEPDTEYYVVVVAQDGPGNLSEEGRDSFRTRKRPDTEPPLVVTGPAVEGKTRSTAIVAVTYNEPVELVLRHATAADGSGAEVIVVSERKREHRMVLIGLEVGTTYRVGLQARDAAGLEGGEVLLTFTTEKEEDQTPPILLTGPLASDVTAASARILWSLDEPAAGEVRVSSSPDLSEAQTLRVLERHKEHAVDLTDLSPGTVYYYQVESTDASGNAVAAGGHELRTLAATDRKPPAITAGPVVQEVRQTRARLFWRTDEAADARAEYHPAVAPDEGLTETRGSLEDKHVLLLTNLAPDAEYAYAVRSRDAAGLESETVRGTFRTKAAPDELPPQFLGQPTVEDLKHDRARLRWHTNEPADSQVRFMPRGGEERQVGEATYVEDHSLVLTHLQPGGEYTFQAGSRDGAGNGPTWSDVLGFVTPAAPDTTPPQFTRRPIVKGRTENSVRLAWSTSEPTAAFVDCGETPDYERGRLARPEQAIDHEWRIGGLQPDRVYHIRIGIVDASGNGPTWFPDFTVTTLAAPDAAPPVILTGPVAVSTTAAEAVIEWSTDEPADGEVVYGLDGQSDTAVDAELRREHRMVLTGLEPGRTYTYTAASRDGARNGPTLSPEMAFATRKEADTRPPAITAGPFALDVTETQATIVWTTDEPATSILDYGPGADYGFHLEDGALVQEHEFALADLTPGTTYHFKVASADLANHRESTDPAGGALHSVDHRFTTRGTRDHEPPIITVSPTVTWTDQTAVVRWGTDELATSRVDWAGGGQEDFVEDNTLVRDHSLTLTGLQPRTAYGFQITSVDAAGSATVWGSTAAKPRADTAAKPLQPPGGAGSFVTDNFPDAQPPVIIAGPAVRARTASSVTIEWETDEPADSQVRFGTSEELGEVVSAAPDVQVHQMTLTNLEPGPQKYYYVVISTDPSGNGPAESSLAVTTPAAEVDLAPPWFAVEPEVLSTTEREVVIGWETDEAASARVEYWAGDGEPLTRQVARQQTRHQVPLTNLEGDTEYQVRVFVTDASQNQVQAPRDLRLRTDRAPDREPPRILSGPEVSAITERGAVVEWITDELSDSFVDFDTTPYLGAVVGDPQYTEAHRVVLTHLEPGKTYYFRVGSTDRARNGPAISEVVQFTTLAAADRTPPPPVEGLRVQPGSEANLLEWEESGADDLAGYVVYREEDGGFAPVATNLEEPRYLDTGLENGRSYRYYVAAVDRQTPPNESAPSAAAEGTPATEGVVGSPVVLGLERGADPGRPVVVVQNARPLAEEARLTYTFQVSTRSDFGDIVDRAGHVPTGFGGLTRWRVGRALAPARRYWWRARAFDGRLEGQWSEPVQMRPREAAAPAFSEDFDRDGTVSFGDFFLFADGFGGTAPALDLDQDGVVGFADFFLFADQFGQTTSSKLHFAHRVQVAPGSELGVEATAASAGEVIVRLDLGGVSELAGYGLGLRFEPPVLRYVGRVDSAGLGGTEASLHLVREEDGGLLLAEHLRGRQQVLKREERWQVGLRFALETRPQNVELRVEQGWIGSGRGRVLRVERLGTARLLPRTYALFPNFPNPFNPATTIPLAIPPAVAGAEFRSGVLVLHNVLGQLVRRWDLRGWAPGYHAVVWDGQDASGRPAASGVYLIRMEWGRFAQTRKLVLLR